MIRASSLAFALTAVVLAAAPAWAASPCDGLAARAKALPAGAWSGGSNVLKPWLQTNEEREAKGALETRLTRDPAVLAAIGDEDGTWAISVDRLAGADLFMVSTTQGTLHCQNSAFVRAGAGGKVRIVKGPPKRTAKDDDDDLCWTRGAAFGRVFGQPVYVEQGDNDQDTDDEDIRIATWAGERWGQACTLKLRYRTAFKVIDRKCRDAAVCAAADGTVVALAAAYDRHKQSRANTPFRYGSGAVPAAIKAAAEASRPSTDVPDWPGFGANPSDRSVSYEGLAYFPLVLGGRAYVAAISHEGIGWRGSSTALLVVYRLEKGKLAAQAAYSVDRVIAGLGQVTASR